MKLPSVPTKLGNLVDTSKTMSKVESLTWAFESRNQELRQGLAYSLTRL